MKRQDLEFANRYIDGELEEQERSVFEKRLLSEERLRALVEELLALDASAGELEVFKAPNVSYSRVLKLSRSFNRPGLKPFLAGAAVVAACVLVLTGLGMRIFNTPSETIPTQVFRVVYYAPGARSVSLVGDFNGWSDEIPLRPRGEGGYWLTEIKVQPGEYRYILMVDGEERPGDPMADYVVDDDFGSKNSVVRIGL